MATWSSRSPLASLCGKGFSVLVTQAKRPALSLDSLLTRRTPATSGSCGATSTRSGHLYHLSSGRSEITRPAALRRHHLCVCLVSPAHGSLHGRPSARPNPLRLCLAQANIQVHSRAHEAPPHLSPLCLQPLLKTAAPSCAQPGCLSCLIFFPQCFPPSDTSSTVRIHCPSFPVRMQARRAEHFVSPVCCCVPGAHDTVGMWHPLG